MQETVQFSPNRGYNLSSYHNIECITSGVQGHVNKLPLNEDYKIIKHYCTKVNSIHFKLHKQRTCHVEKMQAHIFTSFLSRGK